MKKTKRLLELYELAKAEKLLKKYKLLSKETAKNIKEARHGLDKDK